MIGKRILQLRNERDWSASRLAEEANITQAMVTNYENNKVKPTYKVLKKLAKAFGVKIEELTGEPIETRVGPSDDIFESKLVTAKAIKSDDARNTLVTIIDFYMERQKFADYFSDKS